MNRKRTRFDRLMLPSLAAGAMMAGFTSTGRAVPLVVVSSTYTETFDTLAASGTAQTAIPAGWTFLETGSNANTTYDTGNGSNNAGNTYSLGTTSDRAFGQLRSGTLVSTLGFEFTNNTGATITSIEVAYFGERWRLGTADRADKMDFRFATTYTTLTSGTFTDVDALDYNAAAAAAPVGLRDGNLAANRTAITATFNVSIAQGQTAVFSWLDSDASGADDALAIDDFRMAFNGATLPSINPGPVQPGPTNPVRINEIRVDETGTDNSEYFELAGTAGDTLGGLFYIVLGDDTTGFSGVIESVTDLTGQVIPADGFLLVGESTFALGPTPDVITTLNFENDDNVTHLLVRGFTGINGQDLDTNDDGVLDLLPWASILDAVGIKDNVNPPTTGVEFAYGAALGFSNVGPDGGDPPFHVYRLPNGTGAFLIGEQDPTLSNDTPGASNGNVTAVTVPEPATMGLLGVAGLALVRRRRMA